MHKCAFSLEKAADGKNSENWADFSGRGGMWRQIATLTAGETYAFRNGAIAIN